MIVHSNNLEVGTVSMVEVIRDAMKPPSSVVGLTPGEIIRITSHDGYFLQFGSRGKQIDVIKLEIKKTVQIRDFESILLCFYISWNILEVFKLNTNKPMDLRMENYVC